MVQYLSSILLQYHTNTKEQTNQHISAHLVTNLPVCLLLILLQPSQKTYTAACANRYMTGFPASLLGPVITTLVAITKEQPAATDCPRLESVQEKM